MKDVKIHVGKGKSVCAGGPDGEWHKIFYEVEATLDKDENPAAARQEVKDMINQWLQEPLGPEEKPPEPLNPADLDVLPWLTYRTKKPAEPGHSGWIKNPLKNWGEIEFTPAAIQLAKLLEDATNGKIELGEYIYQLSGKEKQFIGRKPIKPPDNSGNDEARPP